MKLIKAVSLLALAAATAAASPASAQDYAARVAKVLKQVPLIDGHNDWPETLRGREGDKRWTMDLRDLGGRADPYNTDIQRLRRGMVGGQFWSVWVSPALPGPQQVLETLEQIDLVQEHRRDAIRTTSRCPHRRRCPPRPCRPGKIASMIGVEGGGQIDESLSVLRSYHALGAGYLTLTHSLTIDWANSATDNPQARRSHPVRREGGARAQPARHARRPQPCQRGDDARRAARCRRRR